MASTLPPKGFFGHTTEYETRSWTALDVPESVEFSDLFDPVFWRHYANANKFKPGHLIRMRRVDGAWDVMLNVIAQVPGGLAVEMWPKVPSTATEIEETEKRKPLDLKSIGRVEHTPATNWRVVGATGNELSRGYTTKAEAMAALKRHAAPLGKEVTG